MSAASTPDGGPVAIVTGASQGIGAGLAAAYRDAGYAVLATARSIAPSSDPHFVTIAGDIADPSTAQHIVEEALRRFERIDTLVNNAGIYIGKPFTEYTLDDYAAITAVNLTGFFHITQRVIGPMVDRGSGHIVNIAHEPGRPRRPHPARRAGRVDQGWAGRRDPVTGNRVRVPRRAGQCRFARRHRDPDERSGFI